MPSKRSLKTINNSIGIRRNENAIYGSTELPTTKSKSNNIDNKGIGDMQIFVKLLNGKTISLDVTKYDTIEKVKQKITNRKENEGIPSRYFHLIYCSKYLKDRYKLNNYKIKKESTIHLKLRIKQNNCSLLHDNNSNDVEGMFILNEDSTDNNNCCRGRDFSVSTKENESIKRSKINNVSSPSQSQGYDKLELIPYSKRKSSAVSSSSSNKKSKRSQHQQLLLTRKSQNYHKSNSIDCNSNTAPQQKSIIIESNKSSTAGNKINNNWDSLFVLIRQCINAQEHLEKKTYNFLFTNVENVRSCSTHRKLFINLLTSVCNMLISMKDGMQIVTTSQSSSTTDTMFNIPSRSAILEDNHDTQVEEGDISSPGEGWNNLFLHLIHIKNQLIQKLHKKVYHFLLSDIKEARNTIPNKLFCNLLQTCVDGINSIKNSIEIVSDVNEVGTNFSIDIGMINLSV